MSSMDVLGELAQLIAKGALSEQALGAMTQIDPARLHTALSGDEPRQAGLVSTDRPGLTRDESLRISILAGMLAGGFSLGDDERLKSIIEGLTAVSRLTVDNIANLINVDAQDVASILRDPAGVPAEVKYAVGIRSSYLINSINLAQPRA